MVYKRYRGKKLKSRGKDWAIGSWVVEFMLKADRVLRAFPQAQTRKERGRRTEKAQESVSCREI